MKFTETSAKSQTALLAVALNKMLVHVSDEYGETEAKKLAAQVFKSIGLTEKEFITLFNPVNQPEAVKKEISAVTKTNKEMFHMLCLVYHNGDVQGTILDNQCGLFKEPEDLKNLIAEVKSLGIVNDSMLTSKNAFKKRCIIADATYRFNKVHGTRHGMKAAPKEPKKSKYTVPPKRKLEPLKTHRG